MSPTFWEWSVAAYRAPGAEAALLALQDAHGLNVNLLLWCVWTAERFSEPDEPVMRQAMLIAGEWDAEIVAPLRMVRRKLKQKGAAEALRAQVRTAELGAEQDLQNALEALARARLRPACDEDAAGRARRMLAFYARAAGAAKTPGFSVSLLERVASLTVARLG